MKKKLWIIVLIILVLIVVVLINFKSIEKLWRTARGRNIAGDIIIENTGLEFQITERVRDDDLEGHDEIYGWFGAREFLGKGYKAITAADEGGMTYRPDIYVTYIITSYPDYSSGDQCVTCIVITDPKVTVFGLSTESDPAEFDRVLKNKGFKVEVEEYGAVPIHRASKGDISIHFENKTITIRAEVTNKEGIVF